MENQREVELDLLGLLRHLKRKIWLILLVTALSGLIGYVGAKMMTTPQYTATTQVYVYQQDKDDIDYNNLSVASQLRRDCAVIIKGESVTKEVVEILGLGMDPKYLGKAIRVDTEDNTRILKISFTHSDPQVATQVVNTVREVAAERTKDLMGTDVLRTLFEASLPNAETTTNVKESTMTAAAVGAVAIIVLLVIFFLLDDTIRNEDDVENYLGLSTLAVIPISSELHVNRGSRGAKGKRMLGNKRGR